MSRCERCPASWESGGMTDCGYECDSYGCLIYGNDILLEDNCKLTKQMVNNRLAQLKAYEDGKVDRPLWVANRFMRELDHACAFSGEPSLNLPAYPPVRMRKGHYFSIYGRIDMNEQGRMDYRRGYEDAKTGRKLNYERSD